MEFYMINLSYLGLWVFIFLIYLVNFQIKKNIDNNILYNVINILIILYIIENLIVVILSLFKAYDFSIKLLSINAVSVFIFLLIVGVIYRITDIYIHK